MSDVIINAVLRILALLASSKRGEDVLLTKKYVENYLYSTYGRLIGKLKYADFIEYLEAYASTKSTLKNLRPLLSLINREYSLKYRIQIFITLLNFISYIWNFRMGFFVEGEQFVNEIDTVASGLRIEKPVYHSIRQFVFKEHHRLHDKQHLLFMGAGDPPVDNVRYLKKEGLKGLITFLYVASGEMILMRYRGRDFLEINRKIVFPNQLYVLMPGTSITGTSIKPIYYGEILATILKGDDTSGITLTAVNVEFTFGSTGQGIHNLSFSCHSGDLVAIMGDSGVGKSTLLNILAGLNMAYSGNLYWNGFDYRSHIQLFRELTGYITQEDSLLEDLTVYQNLYFSSLLSLGEMNSTMVAERVEHMLNVLELFEIKDLIVGSPTNKVISGGQRKRLSIAIELMREPKVLFVDEPTSGLSSADSEKVMNTLKALSLQDILVIVNIHQPSSEIFKLFDKLLVLDKGGYPIFFGNPLEGILYFKHQGRRIDKNLSTCDSCGNVKPEIIFEIIDEKKVSDFGALLGERKRTPKEFHDDYVKQQSAVENPPPQQPIPQPKHQVANLLFQFKIFFQRNVLSRRNNREFAIFSITVPLILSLIISIVSKKYSFTTAGEPVYSFYNNQNIPSFFFMAVIASMFIGMIISADGIFRDRKTHRREAYVKLSRGSSVNAIVLFYILLSAFQTLVFSAIGVWLLHLQAIFFPLWLILFLVSCLGNISGLLVSSIFKSIAGIYLAIPFLFLPQILLSGVVVKFDQLYYKLSSPTVVPVIGDVMASRWAYEAIVVYQFKHNAYEQPLFNAEYTESNLRNGLLYLLPLITSNQEEIEAMPESARLASHEFSVLQSAVNQMNQLDIGPSMRPIHLAGLQNNNLKEFSLRLEKYKENLSHEYNQVIAQKERIIEQQMKKMGGSDAYIDGRDRFQNAALVDLVRNRAEQNPIRIEGTKVTVMVDPIFHAPQNRYGRAHFYAPFKRLGSERIGTYAFNSLVLLVMWFFLYFLLISETVGNIARKVEQWRRSWQSRRTELP